MLKKHTSLGPAAQKILDIAEGRRAPDREQQVILDRKQSEMDASLTTEDKTLLREFQNEEAFNRKYVPRTEYERDLKLAKHDGIVQATTFCILILPTAALFIFLVVRGIGQN